jgi:psp operon transcriptional activator
MSFELGRQALPTFSPAAVQALEAHNWPGNVRELKNVVERAVYRADCDEIDDIDFDPFRSPFVSTEAARPDATEKIVRESGAADDDLDLHRAVSDLELRLLRRALAESRFNRRKAAQLLCLSYDQLRGLLRRYRGQI